MAPPEVSRTAQLPRTRVGAVVIGTLAAFGIIIAGAILAAVAAGFMQWRSTVPDVIDDGLPLLFLGGAMLIAGRVAVDVAGSLGLACAVGAAALIGALGMMIAKTTAAHGDAIEPPQVGSAVLVVLLLVGGTAWFVNRRRSRQLRSGDQRLERPDAS